MSVFDLILGAPFPDQARCHTSDYANQARSLVDKFIKGQDSSRVLLASPEADSDVVSGEKKRLQAERDEIEEDRRNLAEAALKLGRERAALEVQRLEFLEDRRARDVRKMIDDLPPSPKVAGKVAGTSASSVDVKSVLKKKLASPSRRKSKSPMKPQPAKQRRRSSIAVAGKKGRKSVKFGSPPKKAVPVQTLDTELIPHSPPPPSRETIARMTSVEDLLASCSQPKELVTTEFVLPPRSPQSSLPPPPKPTSRALPPFKLSVPSTSPNFSLSDHVPQPSTSDARQLPPESPGRPFPVAKPLAQRMLHAYSPVKPSPLSRVLTVPSHEPPFVSSGNPDDPFDSTAVDTSAEKRAPLATLMEEDWAKPLEDLGKGKEVEKEMTLEEELGISMEIDPDPPLKVKNTPTSPRKPKPSTTKKTTTTSATLRTRAKVEVKKPATTTTAREKGKAKDTENKPHEKGPVKPTTRTRTAAAAGLDKENTVTKRQRLHPPTSPTKPSTSAGSRGTTSSKTTTKPPPPRTRPRAGVTGATASSTARSAAATTTTRAGAGRVTAPPSKR